VFTGLIQGVGTLIARDPLYGDTQTRVAIERIARDQRADALDQTGEHDVSEDGAQ